MNSENTTSNNDVLEDSVFGDSANSLPGSTPRHGEEVASEVEGADRGGTLECQFEVSATWHEDRVLLGATDVNSTTDTSKRTRAEVQGEYFMFEAVVFAVLIQRSF